MFKNAKKISSQDAVDSMNREAAAEQQGGPRIKPKEGLNVYYAAYATGDMDKPCRHVLLHYNPFHICGRQDPDFRMVNGKQEFVTSNKFSDCGRCLRSWDSYVEAGYKKGAGQDISPELKQHRDEVYKPNLSDNKTLVQLIDLTPFFKAGGRSGKLAIPETKKIKAWWGAFVDCLNGAAPPADMPQDIVDAAAAGMQVVILNKTAGVAFHERWLDQLDRGQDPTLIPSERLLKIILVHDKDKQIKDAKVYTREVSWTDSADFSSWIDEGELVGSGFVSYVEAHVKDLKHLSADEGATLAQRAQAMELLSGAEMLELCAAHPGHTWSTTAHDDSPQPTSDFVNVATRAKNVLDDEIPF